MNLKLFYNLKLCSPKKWIDVNFQILNLHGTIEQQQKTHGETAHGVFAEAADQRSQQSPVSCFARGRGTRRQQPSQAKSWGFQSEQNVLVEKLPDLWSVIPSSR